LKKLRADDIDFTTLTVTEFYLTFNLYIALLLRGSVRVVTKPRMSCSSVYHVFYDILYKQIK